MYPHSYPLTLQAKVNQPMKQTTLQTIPGGFSIIVSNFIASSLEEIIPWLITSAAVVLCDLVCGLRKSYLMGERVRFSSAIRRTMGKMVTYFAFVVMVVMVNIASGHEWRIDVYACLLVCFIEFCSVISNILRPKGIELDVIAAIGLFCHRLWHIDKEDVRDVLREDGDNQPQPLQDQSPDRHKN